MVEEFFYPGGFMRVIVRLRPEYAPFFTIPALILLNGLQLALCLIAIVLPGASLVFCMSIAALLLINGIVHIATAILLRGYAPGVITAVALYLPIALSGFAVAIQAHHLSKSALLESLTLGAVYQLVPLAYVRTMFLVRSRRLNRSFHAG